MASLDRIRKMLAHPMNKGRRLRALYRYTAWQIGGRLAPGAVETPFVGNIAVRIVSGQSACLVVHSGLYDFEEMGLLLHTLRPGDVFADVGANVGCYSLLAAATGSRVLAFEPVPASRRELLRNIRLNGLENDVKVFPCALGRSGLSTLRITLDCGAMNHIVETEHPDAIDVPSASCDEIMADRCPLAMKIDVEGYESEVLAGAHRVLDDNTLRAVIIELKGHGRRYGHDENRTCESLVAKGFVACRYDPINRILTETRERADLGGNTIFCRDLAWMRSRVSSAFPYYVPLADRWI